MRNQKKFLILIMAIMIGSIFFKKNASDFYTTKASFVNSKAVFSYKLNLDHTHKITSKKISDLDYLKEFNDKKVKENVIQPYKKDIICRLKSTKTIVPMDGDVQIYVNKFLPFFGNKNNYVAWIKSEACPRGTYSIVQFDDNGRIKEEIDCRYSNITEIAKMSGEQGNIIETYGEYEKINLAISGNGYFVLSCPHGHFMLTRDGSFQRGLQGELLNEDGCSLLSDAGQGSFQDFNFETSGCNSNGDCVATIDPSFDKVDGLEYVSNYSFRAIEVGKLNESVTKLGPKSLRPSFFTNSLEDIHNIERGVTSVSWVNHPHLNLSDINCQ